MADCVMCSKSKNLLNEHLFKKIGDQWYCNDCAAKLIDKDKEALASIILTTTNSIDGFKVEKYIGVDSAEIVLGISSFNNFVSELNSVVGSNSSGFEKKLQEAKEAVFLRLRQKAFDKGASAVLAVDLDYAEFSNNRMGVIASGTLVKLKPS